MYQRVSIGPELQTISLVETKPVFSPSQEEQNLISTWYNDFIYDYSIKNQGWEVLNNRTLDQFWTQSNYDYNQTVIQDVNNPVVQYSSGTTRDKANTLITSLTQNYYFPSVTAFNDQQQIDDVISSIAKPVLRWQYINDGRPSESGKSKGFRYTHKQVAEGTVHILDTIGPDGKLTSQIIPNEEVFIPNFYQPNIQLQSHFFWVNQWASYAEAQAEFGELENFKYVTPGNLGWINQTYEYKEKYKAIVYQDMCTIIRGWYPVRAQEVKRLIKIGKLPKNTKKARYFNVIINGVNMFPWDNLMPYYHGELPVTKTCFEYFSPAEFYWGNSMPNKAAQDKHFRDGWITLMRYVAKLQGIPAMINASGQHLEADVYVPGLTTDVPAGTEPDKFFAVPGTDKPGIIRDLMLMLQQTDSEIDRETVAPIVSGNVQGAPDNVRGTQIVNQRATDILIGLAQRLAEREEARAFPILKASFQFLPRQTVKSLSIPNEIFPDGSMGNLEIVFQKLPNTTPEERLVESHKLRDKELGIVRGSDGLVSRTNKPQTMTKQVMIDIEYIQNLDLYCEAIAEELPRNNSISKISEAEHKWQTYAAAPPGIFNIKPAARNLVRAFGDNEKELIAEAPPQMPPGMPGQPQLPGQPPPPGNPSNSLPPLNPLT